MVQLQTVPVVVVEQVNAQHRPVTTVTFLKTHANKLLMPLGCLLATTPMASSPIPKFVHVALLSAPHHNSLLASTIAPEAQAHAGAVLRHTWSPVQIIVFFATPVGTLINLSSLSNPHAKHAAKANGQIK